jgi:tetratricopeptide (TPR) repeat protein
VSAWFNQQHAVKGDELRLAGKYDEALAEYKQADQNNPATIIGEGLTYAAQKQYQQALDLITPLSQDIAPTHLALGYIWQLQGNSDYARREFESRPVALDENNADHWAWQELPTPNQGQVTMGPFDWGQIDNFHYFQTDQDQGKIITYRWTDGQGSAKIRFPKIFAQTASVASPSGVYLRLKGYRPSGSGLAAPLVEVLVDGYSVGQIQTTSDWKTYSLPFPQAAISAWQNSSGPVTLEIKSPTFVPDANDRRELGVMVEWVGLNCVNNCG